MARRIFFRSLVVAIALLGAAAARAAPAFNNVDQGQFDQILRDFSANAAYSSVSPASSLGSLFGFEFGVIAGISNSPKVDTLVKQVDSNASAPLLPNAGLMGALTVPGGLTVEALFMPSTTISGISYGQMGGALKWTFTDGVIVVPFSMALKGFYSSTKSSFSQVINNSSTSNVPVVGTVEVADSLYGLQFIASKDLIFIEPYVGVGFMNASGTASVSGAAAATIFAPSFTAAQSATTSASSSEIFFGLNFKLALIRIGAEYARLYDTDRYSAKLSFAF